jgi:hypothetical protein
MAWGKSRESRGNGVGCLALLVALAALFVAWSAYRRTGGTWGELTRGALDRPFTVSASSDWEDALKRAREKLTERRSEVAAERNLEQVGRDVAAVRKSLERSFRDAGEAAKARWRGLDGDLGRLEAQLREGGAQAKATLDEILDKMKG